ncbi:YvcK family protein [Candidatus Berkelbacteria bacterium]|nr:YvcK family protein [Candidatus Berkelbacteria bacterium]
MRRKRVVAVGGGTGLYTLLRGLKNYDLDLTAVVTMTDDGGSTGELRDEYGVLPPGDVRRCIVALSESSEMMKELFQYRFVRGSMAGHSFGNLFITALKELTDSDEAAIEQASKLLKVKGKVLPVTLDNRKLKARLEDGQVIQGETNIDLPKHDGHLKIDKVFLDKPATPNSIVVKALERADMIILGPGDLYTSVIPNLLVKNISQAINKSRAKKVYICNLMTKFGETNGFFLHDFIEEIRHYLHAEPDYVVWSPVRLSKKLQAKYLRQQAQPVRLSKAKLSNLKKTRIIEASVVSKADLVRHDSNRLAKLTWSLVNLNNHIKFIDG